MPPRKIKLGKTGADVFGAVGDSLSELEPLFYDYKSVEDDDTRSRLKSTAIQIKKCFRQTLTALIEIGRYLIQEQEALPYGVFQSWVSTEFADLFSYESVNNYMNLARLAEKYSAEDLRKMPIGTLYKLARKNVPEMAIAEAINVSSQDVPVTPSMAEDIVRKYKELQLEQAGIAKRAKNVLIETDVPKDPDTLKRIARLDPTEQLKVARLLESNPELTPRSVLREAAKAREERQVASLASSRAGTATAVYQHHDVHQGPWPDLLDKLEAESVDLCFAEMPQTFDALEDYATLAECLYPALKDGGMLLCTCGHKSIQFVGNKLDPLTVAWTFMIRRQAGNSPRVLGRISYASSYIPLSLSYKGKLRALPGTLLDDLRFEKEEEVSMASRSIADTMKLNLQTEEQEPEHIPSGIENSVEYYIQKLLQPTDSFVHLVAVDRPNLSYNDVAEMAFKADASRVISLIGN